MRGEQLTQVFAGFGGVYGDRFYAFVSSGASQRFPYLTAREKETMLLYSPKYRNAERMMAPPNLAEATALAPGLTPFYPTAEEMMVDVQTPAGEILPIDDLALISRLREGLRERHEVRLVQSHRSMTDCRPVSVCSVQTVRQLSSEVGTELDKRRFRANIYLNFGSQPGFSEDNFVGHQLRVGETTVLAILHRDSRCKIITLDPENARPNPAVMRRVAANHEGKAGVYGAVLVEGTVAPGDPVVLLA